MISKKYIKQLDFETIEDIYIYIVDSAINGSYSQVRQLINKLSREQYLNFLKWLEHNTFLNYSDKIHLQEFRKWKLFVYPVIY